MNRSALPAVVLLALSLHPAAAQQPTAEQTSAIRSSCRSDFMANCSGVQPGGKDALECLIRYESRLSASCKAAVDAVVAKPAVPAPASAPAASETATTPTPAPAKKPAPENAPAAAAARDKSAQNWTLPQVE
jgi:hypothetical protein